MATKHSTQDAELTAKRTVSAPMQLSIVPQFSSTKMQAQNLALIANFSRMGKIERERFLAFSEILSARSQTKNHLKIVDGGVK